LVFLGFSCSDFHIRTALRQYCHRWPASRPQHYALLPNPDRDLVDDLLSLGIYTIPYTPTVGISGEHQEIRAVLEWLTEDRPIEEREVFPVVTREAISTPLPGIDEINRLASDEQLRTLNAEFGGHVFDIKSARAGRKRLQPAVLRQTK
jgi:hypothetical protein